MHRTAIIATLAVILFLPGCRTNQAKVADLQKEYDQVNQRFAKDCSAEMFKLPDQLSPKCAEESKKLKDVTNQLQAARSKN